MSRYADLRNELIRMRSEFGSYQYRVRSLGYDLIGRPDGEPWTKDGFNSFVDANERVGGVPWEKWELWPDGTSCGRFWGINSCEKWVLEFKQLASRAFLTLHEMGMLVQNNEPVPDEFGSEIPTLRRTEGLSTDEADFLWLELLHDWGNRFATSHLQVGLRIWNYPSPEPTKAEFEAVLHQTTTPDDGGASYHQHPLCSSLLVDVFVASAELIRLFVEPDEVIRIGMWDSETEIYLPGEPEKPNWDGDRLWFRNALVKDFIKPAEDQRAVLAAFESEDWPEWVENPFLNDFELARAISKLENAVKGLNDDHKTKGLVRFGSRNEKQYAYWKAIDE